VSAPLDRAIHVALAVEQIFDGIEDRLEALRHIESLLRDEFADVQRETLNDAVPQ
jgi:hypothetical protein